MWRRLAGLTLALFALLAGVADAQAARRIALVIGNAAYETPSWRLANPARDADLIAARLDRLGFDVDLVRDADRREMEAAFGRFSNRLLRAGPDAVSVVFYAGHGAEDDGVNYLIPVDANARTSDQLRFQAPPLQFLLDDMARAGNAVNIVILDACRDMPLPDGARSLGRGGLAAVDEAPNVFIAYATAPGRTAPDGSGYNSPFTEALGAALAAKADQPISLLFEDVQAEVQARSGGAQRPRFSNGLAAPRWAFAAAVATPAPASAPRIADPRVDGSAEAAAPQPSAKAPTIAAAPVASFTGPGQRECRTVQARAVRGDGQESQEEQTFCQSADGRWTATDLKPPASTAEQNQDVIVVTGRRKAGGSGRP